MTSVKCLFTTPMTCPDCGHFWGTHAFPGCVEPMPRTLPNGLKVETCGCTAMLDVSSESTKKL